MTARKETAGEQELKILIGPKFPLWAQHPTDLSNQKVPGTNTVELIFAPAAAAIIFIKETGEDTGVSLANAGYDPNETRIPAGQPVGGQWTAAGAGGAQITKALVETPPPRLVLSGGNDWRLGESLPDLTGESGVEPITWGDVAEVWKGEGDAVTETVCGMWNAAWHPITTAEGIREGLSIFAKDPGGTLKAIGQQIADDFTGGDLRKAGKLVGLVLITLGTGVAAGKLATLLPKVPLPLLVRKVVAAASGKPVRLTAEEAEIIQRVMSGEVLQAPHSGLLKALQSGTDVLVPPGTTGIRTMMADITANTGNEVALLRLTNGSRVFRLGTPKYVLLGPDVKTVIAHTHSGGILEFSESDFDALTARGQRSSVLIDPKSAFGTRVSISGKW